MTGPSLVQVWSVSDPDWACSIEEGAAGVQHARWAPDGQHVLVVSDFQIRTSVWSLVTKQCAHFFRRTQSTFQATFIQCAVPQACTSQDPSCLRTAWPSALTGARWRWQRCGPRLAGLLCPAHWIT